MKIAIFSDCYLDLTGGIVSSINAQKKALEDRGHEVVIFSTGYPKSSEEQQEFTKKHIFMVPSCRYCFRGLTPVSRKPDIVMRWLKHEHPELKTFDIFYIHYEAGCSIAGLKLAQKLKIPTVQVMHGREDMGVSTVVPRGLRTIVGKFLCWLHSRFIPHPVRIQKDNFWADSSAKAAMWTLMVNHANFADLVLVPSEHFGRKLVHYGVKKPLEVMPNGYPDDKFPAQVSAKLLESGKRLRIIWHSRVQEEKRIMPFLKALTMVPKDWEMNVYGSGTELRRAQKYSKRHNLPIKFHGDQPFDKVRSAIEKSHLDVLMSYNYDTFGMTLIEAEAYGAPVLICDPDLTETIPRSGYLLANGPDPKQIANALRDLLSHPEKIQQMSEVMIGHRDEVLISSRIKKLEKIFHKLLKNK